MNRKRPYFGVGYFSVIENSSDHALFRTCLDLLCGLTGGFATGCFLTCVRPFYFACAATSHG